MAARSVTKAVAPFMTIWVPSLVPSLVASTSSVSSPDKASVAEMVPTDSMRPFGLLSLNADVWPNREARGGPSITKP